MRSLKSPRWLIAGSVAAIVVVAGGYTVFRLMDSPDAAEAEHAEDEEGHADEGGEEGHIDLTPAQVEAADIEVVAVGRGGGEETHIAGRVEPMVDARAAVAAYIGGRVERVLVAPGQSVRAGQALVVLISGDAASLRAEADAAQAAYVAAEQAHARDEELAEQGVVAQREAEVSHAEALSAQAAARAARARAEAAGAPSASGRVQVVSPISGVVTNVQVGPGGFVPQAGVVAEVSNPSRLELIFNAPPRAAR